MAFCWPLTVTFCYDAVENQHKIMCYLKDFLKILTNVTNFKQINPSPKLILFFKQLLFLLALPVKAPL